MAINQTERQVFCGASTTSPKGEGQIDPPKQDTNTVSESITKHEVSTSQSNIFHCNIIILDKYYQLQITNSVTGTTQTLDGKALPDGICMIWPGNCLSKLSTSFKVMAFLNIIRFLAGINYVVFRLVGGPFLWNSLVMMLFPMITKKGEDNLRIVNEQQHRIQELNKVLLPIASKTKQPETTNKQSPRLQTGPEGQVITQSVSEKKLQELHEERARTTVQAISSLSKEWSNKNHRQQIPQEPHKRQISLETQTKETAIELQQQMPPEQDNVSDCRVILPGVTLPYFMWLSPVVYHFKGNEHYSVGWCGVSGMYTAKTEV